MTLLFILNCALLYQFDAHLQRLSKESTSDSPARNHSSTHRERGERGEGGGVDQKLLGRQGLTEALASLSSSWPVRAAGQGFTPRQEMDGQAICPVTGRLSVHEDPTLHVDRSVVCSFDEAGDTKAGR